MAELYNVDSPITRGQRNNVNATFEDIQRQIGGVVLRASQAKDEAKGVQEQLNTIVVNGDSSVEAAQARVGVDGIARPTLKARIDDEVEDVFKKIEEVNEDFVRASSLGFLGDGTQSDTQLLQNILNQSVLEKRKVVLPDKECILFKGLIINGNLVLEGTKNTVLKLVPNTTENDSLLKVSSGDVSLIGFSLECSDLPIRGINSNTNGRIEISNISVKDTGKIAIFVENSNYGFIKNCFIDGSSTIDDSENYRGAIHVIYSRFITIDKCEVRNAKSKGIEILVSQDVLVKDSVVINTTANAGDGIYVGIQTNRVIVDACSSLDAQGNALKISRGAQYTVVKNCKLQKTRGVGYGILVQGGIGVNVDGCDVKSEIGGVLYVEDHIPDGASDSRDVIIQNSKLTTTLNSAPAVQITNRVATPEIVKDIKIIGNIISGGTFGVLSSIGYVEVKNNVIKDCNNVPVSFILSTLDNGVYIEGNEIHSPENRNGIEIIRCAYSNIRNNNIYINGGNFGIVCSTGCKTVDVAENKIVGASSTGISSPDITSTDIIVRDNFIDGSGVNPNGNRGVDYRGLRGKVINNTITNYDVKVFIATQQGQEVVNTGN